MRQKEETNIEWKQKRFMECLVPVSFERLKQVQANSYLKEGKYPVVDQGQNLIAGWTNDESKIIRKNLPLIIFGDHTRIFKYVDFPFALGADGTKLIKPKQDEFSTRFFYYCLLTLNIPERGYNRHYKLLKEQVIHYPSFAEQQKIAAVLFKIQQAIEVQESIIEKMRELKKSSLHHVFTHGLREEKLRETEIGRIPENWTLKNVGSILKLSSGKTRPGKISNNKSSELAYPVYGGNGIMGYSAKFFVSDKVLIIGRVGEYCGAVHVSSEPSWISDNALYSKEWLDSNVSLAYLAAYLGFIDLNRMKRKSSQPLISQSIVQELKVPIPSETEQEEIVNILNELDRRIELLKEKKSALHDLFRTMLNKLMTGEIRVKDLDIDVSKVSA